MSTDAPTGARVRPPREGRSNGQWLVNGQEPLNPNEVFKAADNGLTVRERIESVYAHEGFASIPADDLHGRMRWWGLYTQRKQGIDGGRTGDLSADELSDEYFMMRVRLDGGSLTLEQLRVVAQDRREGNRLRTQGRKLRREVRRAVVRRQQHERRLARYHFQPHLLK